MFKRLFGKPRPTEATSPTKPEALIKAQAEIATLRRAVFDLFVEVEAIRATLLKSELGGRGVSSPYAESYRDTVLTTHCSTGCTGGYEKLLSEFYPASHNYCSLLSGLYESKEEWRECLFMRRLGMSPLGPV